MYIYYILLVFLFRCVSRFFLGISLSLKLCSIYTFDLQFTLVRVCLSKPSGLLLPPSGVLLGLTVARVLGEGESPLVPLSGSFPDYLALFGLVFGRLLKFDSPRKTRGGGKTTFDSPFFQGCAFSFLLMSVLSELWPITIATSYIVNLLIRIFLGTRCFSIFYTTCVSWLLFRPCSGLPHVPLSFWNQSPFYRVHLHLRLSIIYLRFQVLIPSFRGISVSEIRFYLYIYLDLLLLANYTKHCP